MLLDLGESIVDILSKSPDGALIFFPSYSQMDAIKKLWEENGIIKRLEWYKSVYFEPKISSRFKQIRKNFEADAISKGAVLIGVCRGKISEGLDFSDRAARCVIVVGMPFAQWKDPKIQLKMEYLDTKYKKGLTPINGRSWYNQESSRAINQAIGRIIRHRHDYGLVVLVDERYANKSSKIERSKWLRDRQTNYESFGKLPSDIQKFFKEMKDKNFPTKELNSLKYLDEDEESYNSDKETNFVKSEQSTIKQKYEKDDIKNSGKMSDLIFTMKNKNSSKEKTTSNDNLIDQFQFHSKPIKSAELLNKDQSSILKFFLSKQDSSYSNKLMNYDPTSASPFVLSKEKNISTLNDDDIVQLNPDRQEKTPQNKSKYLQGFGLMSSESSKLKTADSLKSSKIKEQSLDDK